MNEEKNYEEVFEDATVAENQADDVVSEENKCPCVRCGSPCEEGEDYCGACLEKMLNTRIPLIAWMAGAASIIMGIVSAAAIFFLAAPSILSITAETAAMDNRWSDAYYYYQQMDTTVTDFQSLINWESGKNEPVLRRILKIGTETKSKMVEAYAKAYNPMDAIYEIIAVDYSSYDAMVAAEGDLLESKRVKPYWELYNSLSYTEALLYYAEEAPGEDASYEENIKFLEKASSEKGVDSVYIAYQKYSVAKSMDQPFEEMLKHIEECDSLAQKTGRDYRWLYYYDYAELLAQTGEYEGAIAMLDVLTKENRNDFNAYLQKTDILILSDKIDEAEKFVQSIKSEFGNYAECYEMEIKVLRCKGELDKAKAMCETVIGENDMFPEIRRQLALIYLTEGDLRNAFDQANTAYNNAYNVSYYGNSEIDSKLIETLYLCAKLYHASGNMNSNDSAAVGQVLDLFSDNYKPKEKTSAVLSGKITLNEVLTGRGYDIV